MKCEQYTPSSLIFDSKYTVGEVLESRTDAEIKAEPMFFSANFSHAYENGGPITREFLYKLGPEWKDGVFDSRVHMLMPGWYPCIPGYHHDDVPRTREDKQPNYENPEYHSLHVMATVNGVICPTYGIENRGVVVPSVSVGEKVYEKWHKWLTAAISDGMYLEHILPSETLIHFDSNFFHRGSKAVTSGWRWFGRISRNTNRTITNENRTQVQVYIDDPDAGW